MRSLFIRALVSTAALSVTGVAMADTVLFADNFEQESFGLNYNSFANWDVNPGTVDLIGRSGNTQFFDLSATNQTKYVDLDGSTNRAGTMTSKSTWTFAAGVSYKLQFDLAGNRRGAGSDLLNFSVQVGNFASTITTTANQDFQTYSFTFIGNGSTGGIVFNEQGADNQGQLLDNVQLSVVPLPAAAWSGMATLAGIGGLTIVRRRKMA